MSRYPATQHVPPVDRTVVRLGTGAVLRRGGAWRRTGAVAVDIVVGAVLWAVVYIAIVVATLGLDAGSTGLGLGALVGGFLAAVTVYGLFYGLQRTLGQALFGLRTVRTVDGRPVGAWAGIRRMLGAALLVPLVPILVIGLVLSASAYTAIDKPKRYAVISTR
ncbi:hypothetical protein GM708_17815 [Vibrio cholerae]|jgi:hypothetical protein|nr:hypothetical protein [Vibrio cholerae]